MKQIFIFRHGKVKIENNRKIYAYEFKEWIDRYNDSDIYLDKTINNNKNIIDKSDIIICSSLKRSIQSANFFDNKQLEKDAIFNEAELPYTKFYMLKLKPITWLVIFRILWFLGYSKNCESYKNTKLRAKKASLKLINLSKEYDNIILFGHGIFNRLLVKEMLLNNWKIRKKLSNKNLCYGIIEQG